MTKKRLLALFCCFALLTTAGCTHSDFQIPQKPTAASSEPTTPSTEPPTEPECQHVYEEFVAKEPNYGVNGYNIKSCTLCSEQEYITVPALPAIFELTLVDKYTLEPDEEDPEYWVCFTVEIKNTSDMTIESISGKIDFTKPAWFMLHCDFEDLSIGPYETKLVYGYGFTLDPESEQDRSKKKIYDAEMEEIQYSFATSDVVVEEE